MSDSVQPYGQQPSRLFCPQDSPGKNIGAGCQFLLQEVELVAKINEFIMVFRYQWKKLQRSRESKKGNDEGKRQSQHVVLDMADICLLLREASKCSLL